MNGRERFLSALRFEEVDRPPLWIMRQAGRYLPEYRALREKHSFIEICKTPELAIEATMQPIRRFGFDAAIVFSDILYIPEAMGQKLEYLDNGPRLEPLLESPQSINALRSPDVSSDLAFVAEAVSGLRKALALETALIGFSGAPFTLAHYMISPRSSRDFTAVKLFAYNYPAAYAQLLEMLTAAVGDYLLMQAQAGADVVQIFDSWGGELSPFDYETLALPYVHSLVERLHGGGYPVIYYVNGVAGIARQAASTGADVLGVDWRVGLADLRKTLGEETVLQGNLDPALLYAPNETIVARTHAMLDESGGRGHIVNLGKGITPDAPVAGVEALIEAVKSWRRR